MTNGFVIERGSSDNVFIGWDESADAVTFGTGSFTGVSTGNLTITPSAVNTGALTITNATNSVEQQEMYTNQLQHLQVQTVQLGIYGFFTLNK